jgi:hypothetical protein
MAEIAQERYTTPLAKWSRVLEIFIPGYMFGKAWGIANQHTVDLYKVIFPSFLIEMAEYMKTLVQIDSPSLGRFYSTSAGALVGFGVILLLGLVMHLVLGDRKYIDSLRFTSITLIPLAVMHGTLTHVTNTVFESLGGGETIEALTKAAVDSPRGQIQMFCVFYMLALWMMAKRTGVYGKRRWFVLLAGVGFLVVYFWLGLGITTMEAAEILPKMMAAQGQH